MTCTILYSLIIKGRESKCRVSLHDARHRAAKLRNIHGKFNVWLRPQITLEVR